jgi:hypothetical protein
MAAEKDFVLSELERMLRGPRRARRRLLSEIDEHLTDGIAAELAAGSEGVIAEMRVVGRFGSPAAVAAAWNAHQDARRGATRRRVVLLAVVAAGAGALGVTQYASGKTSPRAEYPCPRAELRAPCPAVEPPSR